MTRAPLPRRCMDQVCAREAGQLLGDAVPLRVARGGDGEAALEACGMRRTGPRPCPRFALMRGQRRRRVARCCRSRARPGSGATPRSRRAASASTTAKARMAAANREFDQLSIPWPPRSSTSSHLARPGTPGLRLRRRAHVADRAAPSLRGVALR